MLRATNVSSISEKEGSGIAPLVLKLCGQKMALAFLIFLLAGSWELQALFPVAQEQHPSSSESSSPWSCPGLPGSVGLPWGRDFLKSKRISPEVRFFEPVLLKIHNVFKY